MFCFVALFPVNAEPVLKVCNNSNRPSPASAKISFNSKLVLKGSRGETLNYMIKLKNSTSGHFELKGLRRKGTSISLNLRPRFYTMETLDLTQPSYDGAKTGLHFDPLVPVLGDIAAGENDTKWFWGELTIPYNAKPGLIKGYLSFANLSVPLELTVWKMKMPKTPIFPMYANIEADVVETGHYKKERDYSDWEEYVDNLDPALMTRYLDVMRDHQMFPIKSWIEAPGVIKDDNGKDNFDIFNYPKPRVSYYNVTISKTPKSIYFDFPAKIYGYDDINNTSLTKPYYSAIQKTLKELGYPKNAMTFLWDEPLAAWADTGENYIPMLIKYAKQVKTWAPNLKIMSTMPATKNASKCVDIFVPAPNYFGTLQKKIGEVTLAGYRKLQRQKKEVWWYVSCMSHGCSDDCKGCNAQPEHRTSDLIVDRPAVYIRSLAWLAAKYNIQAFFYYDTTQAYRDMLEKGDVWDNNYRFAGNGDGTLFYPGRPGEHGLTEHQPIASARMKIWRETSNDYQYIKWMQGLKKKPKWWTKQFKLIARSPTNWEKRYAKYQALRNKVGNFLNKKLLRIGKSKGDK